MTPYSPVRDHQLLVAPNGPTLPCWPTSLFPHRPNLATSESNLFSSENWDSVCLRDTHKTTRCHEHTHPFPANSSYSFNILRFTECLSQELFHCKRLFHYVGHRPLSQQHCINRMFQKLAVQSFVKLIYNKAWLYLGSFEVWCWRRMRTISWTDRVNDE